VAILVGGRIKYIDRPAHLAPLAMPATPQLPAATTAIEKPKPKRASEKIDPKYLKAARELRDRYLEEFNRGAARGAGGAGLVLPAGKYEVSRALPESRQAVKALPAAA
jgi:hypothetical protein